jgi:hypothetical protein
MVQQVLNVSLCCVILLDFFCSPLHVYASVPPMTRCMLKLWRGTTCFMTLTRGNSMVLIEVDAPNLAIEFNSHVYGSCIAGPIFWEIKIILGNWILVCVN